MNVSLFLAIKAVISTLTGLIFLLVSEFALSLYGATLNAQGLFFVRLFSAMAIGIGLICWFIRDKGSEERKAVLLSLFLADSIGFAITLIAQLQGLINNLGWANVGLWLFLALGLGYFRFISKSS